MYFLRMSKKIIEILTKELRSIYGKKFRPQDIDVKKVTHILYAFGDIASDGSV